jgi:S1-C subfamily serine protease
MSDTPSSSPLASFSAAVAELVHRAAPSVVSVHSRGAESSGFVWRPGLVVTAENAIADDNDISIVAHDGASASAALVGRDPSTDVLLLRVQRTDLPQAPLIAGSLAAGMLALVVGAREGRPVASLGIVSYAGPQWRSMRGGLIDARIELSAGLRRSSEGGLAVDPDGRAFGMAAFGPRRRTLVIPFATIDRAAETLLAKGRVARGYVGLGLQPVQLDGGGGGLMAISVDPKGPGAAAGVRQGDVIVAWNGEPLRGVHHLMRALGPDSVGQVVKLSVRRGGEPLEVALTIDERPQAQ